MHGCYRRGRRESRGSPGKDFTRETRPKFCWYKLFVVGVAINQRCWFRVFTHASKKALLIILPKHSLIGSRQCNGKRKKKSKMKPRKVKNKNSFKSLVGPLFSIQVWGPRGSIPCSPPPLGRPIIGRWVGWMDV